MPGDPRGAAARQPSPDVTQRLRAARGFVLDLDGTLVLGDSRNHLFGQVAGRAKRAQQSELVSARRGG